MSNIAWAVAGTAALGSLLQEVLWWWNIRRSLEEPVYQALMRSIGYWAVTLVTVALSGLVALVWFNERDYSLHDVLVFGAFLPLILKQAGKAVAPGQQLGAADESAFSLRRYLG